MYRVVLVDDHEMVRRGAKHMLETDPEIEVVGHAAGDVEARTLVAREKPDVVFMGITMENGENGVVTCADLVRQFPSVKVIILSANADPGTVRTALRAGASGYLMKTATSQELHEAVHKVAAGGTYLQSVVAECAQASEGATGVQDDLTPRELRVLQLLARGYTNKQAAEKAYVSVKTIEAYRARLYQKLGFQTRVDLVEYALKNGLLAP